MQPFNPETFALDHDAPDPHNDANYDYAYVSLILIAFGVVSLLLVSAYGCSMVIGL